jgi:hypothetical protein
MKPQVNTGLIVLHTRKRFMITLAISIAVIEGCSPIYGFLSKTTYFIKR